MFNQNVSQGKKIIFALLTAPLVIALVFLEYYEYVPEDTWFWTFILLDSVFDLIFPELTFLGQKRKKFYYKNQLLGVSMIEQLNIEAGQQIRVKTLDEVVKGVVKSTDGDFIVIEKDKKTSVETVFVNKNAIQTIRIVKIK